MIDVVFVVDDPVAWHAQNLQTHPSHYSGLGSRGLPWISRLQRHGAHMYYNTLLPMPAGVKGAATGQQLKYGVISTGQLVQDLTAWSTLYMAGRLHKPVAKLKPPPPAISSALHANLIAAGAAGALLLPPTFTASQWLTSIAGLSYLGDFRMLVGENPRKVSNIVAGNIQRFGGLYAPQVDSPRPIVACAAPSAFRRLRTPAAAAALSCSRDVSVAGAVAALECLPSGIASRIEHGAVKSGGGLGDWQAVARSTRMQIGRTVATAAAVQSIKGLFTAGWGKGGAYIAAKLGKQLKGLLRR